MNHSNFSNNLESGCCKRRSMTRPFQGLRGRTPSNTVGMLNRIVTTKIIYVAFIIYIYMIYEYSDTYIIYTRYLRNCLLSQLVMIFFGNEPSNFGIYHGYLMVFGCILRSVWPNIGQNWLFFPMRSDQNTLIGSNRVSCQRHYLGVSKNRGIPKWLVYNGKPYQNGWFGGTPIFGLTPTYL